MKASSPGLTRRFTSPESVRAHDCVVWPVGAEVPDQATTTARKQIEAPPRSVPSPLSQVGNPTASAPP